jgi:aconitate hydratase
VKLTGRETYNVEGIGASLNGGGRKATVRAVSDDGKETTFTVLVRVDTPQEVEYYRNGGILPYVLRQLAAQGAGA